MLKTISKGEFNFLRKIIEEYHIYLTNNPNTLIPRYYGLHEIITKKGFGSKSIYFLVMQNQFHSNYTIDRRYDLKGSSQGRTTDPSEDSTVARKDLDWNADNMKIQLGEPHATELLN